MSFILQSFQEGGIFMYVILLFLVLTVGFMSERFIVLYYKTKAPSAGFRDQILGFIAQGDLRGAENFAKTTAGSTGLGKIAALGCHIRANAGGEEELQARMDEKLANEISMIDRRTGFLGMFGNVATLLGLLGTISGMIHSFSAVAQSSPMDRATLLSKGISEAMNCTAFGLIVAIPALVAYAIYQNKTDRLVNALTEGTTEIYHDLVFLTETEASMGTQRSASNSRGSSKSSERSGVQVPGPSLSV